MSNLVKRLRETASKGVSVWGDLQMEAADEIERLQSLAPGDAEKGTQNVCTPVNEEEAFNEWFTQRKRASFPKDYDESRFANWAENYRPDSWRGWQARADLAHPLRELSDSEIDELIIENLEGAGGYHPFARAVLKAAR